MEGGVYLPRGRAGEDGLDQPIKVVGAVGGAVVLNLDTEQFRRQFGVDPVGAGR